MQKGKGVTNLTGEKLYECQVLQRCPRGDGTNSALRAASS